MSSSDRPASTLPDAAGATEESVVAATEPEHRTSSPAEAESQPSEPQPSEPQSVRPEPSQPEPSQPEPSEPEPLEPDSAEDDSGLPDVTADTDLECALEALLLVVDSPVEESLLATTLDQPVARVRATLMRMSGALRDGARGIDLRKVGDGWRLFTRDRYAPYVERMLLDGQRSKLTRAALETLAVIAYRQPVTRARVAAVRGVNVDGVIRTLLARGLVEEVGQDPDTQGILYRTTELFLERLGLASLADLPPIAPLLPEVDSIDDV